MQYKGLLPAVITYNALISACEKGTLPQRALQLLETMRDHGLLPNLITHNAATSACEKGQKPQQARISCSSCSPEASCPK